MEPFTVDTNSWGHRDREHAPDELHGSSVRRVLLLGDSFTFGTGVRSSELFAARLQAALPADERRRMLAPQSASIITDREWDSSLRHIREFAAWYSKQRPRGFLLIQTTAAWDDGTSRRLEALEDSGTTCFVDLRQEALALPDSERSIYGDGHWTPRMHEVSARCLAAAILRREGRELPMERRVAVGVHRSTAR